MWKTIQVEDNLYFTQSISQEGEMLKGFIPPTQILKFHQRSDTGEILLVILYGKNLIVNKSVASMSPHGTEPQYFSSQKGDPFSCDIPRPPKAS